MNVIIAMSSVPFDGIKTHPEYWGRLKRLRKI